MRYTPNSPEKFYFAGLLHEEGLKITHVRLDLLVALSKLSKPISIKYLEKKLSKYNKTTLYRTLEMLVEADLTKRMTFNSSESLYEIADRPHHHHIICETCGKIEDIQACAHIPTEKTLLKKGFATLRDHSLEFFGTCLKCAGVILLLFLPFTSHAQQIATDKQEIVKAQVLQVLDQSQETIPDTNTLHNVQNISVKILEGMKSGQNVTFRNDFIMLKEGEIFYLAHVAPWDGSKDIYAVSEPYRIPQLGWLLVIFIALVVIFGGKQGMRGFLSLVGSLIFILFALLPGILRGYDPVSVSIGISSVIIVIGSYVTHGFNKTTSCAVIGMIITIVIVGIFAHFAIDFTKLSGLASEEATFLNFNSQGSLNLAGVLLGGILIGLLGVMYDAAIGQAVSVEELHQIAPHVDRRTIYTRALRIGREHIGALVNTLAIAYVGASLPLLLLFYSASGQSIGVIINREIFSTEIVRTLIGSAGLVLAVPITTAVAVYILVKKK